MSVQFFVVRKIKEKAYQWRKNWYKQKILINEAYFDSQCQNRSLSAQSDYFFRWLKLKSNASRTDDIQIELNAAISRNKFAMFTVYTDVTARKHRVGELRDG